MTTPEHVTAQTLADLHRVNLALPAALARLADMRSGYSEVASGGQRNPGRPLGDPNTTTTLDRARDDRRHLDRLIIRIAADTLLALQIVERYATNWAGTHSAPTNPADATDANGDPLWCRNCITTGWCNPIAPRYKTGRLCRFCGDRLALEGAVPTDRMIRLHAQGKRVPLRDGPKGPQAKARAARKAKRR